MNLFNRVPRKNEILFSAYNKVDRIYREKRCQLAVQYSVRYCKDGLILDCGAGKGELSILLQKIGYSVVSLDIDKSELVKAKRNEYQGEIVVGDATQLPLKDSLFDGIVCIEVIEHVFLTSKLLEEITRVSKNGGLLILSTPNGQRLIKTLVKKLIRMELKIGRSHVYEFSLTNLLKMLHQVKFRPFKVLKLALDIPTPLLVLFPRSLLYFLLEPKEKIPFCFCKFIVIVAQK